MNGRFDFDLAWTSAPLHAAPPRVANDTSPQNNHAELFRALQKQRERFDLPKFIA
jgi:hypothetical protein